MTVASALKKAQQTKRVCGLSRRGTGRGYEVRETIEVPAHPDLATLADRVERLQAALESIIKGNPRCSTPRAILAWAQDEARTALADEVERLRPGQMEQRVSGGGPNHQQLSRRTRNEE